MKVWIVEDINGETIVAQTATVAYNICRKSISENEDDADHIELIEQHIKKPIAAKLIGHIKKLVAGFKPFFKSSHHSNKSFFLS